MFEHDFFRLNAGVADGLKGIKGLKIFVARLGQYEYAAKLRDIEKLLENVSEQLSYCKYPAPHKGLTPKGKSYYNHLFNYCIANNWKGMPENFKNLFMERKSGLNSAFEFNDGTSAQLVDLNKKLAAEEGKIHEFFNFKQLVVFANGFKDLINRSPNGSLTIKCYTQSNYYEFTHGGFNPAVPFYQLEFPLNDFIKSMPIFYSEDEPASNFLSTLLQQFGDEKICLLFALLASDGLLAWEDFMNIDRVEIELDLKYKFFTGIPT